MPAEIRSFTVTTQVGVAKGAPQITALPMPPRTVREIEIRIPPGPNGELGFAIGMAGQNIIPFNAGEWIVTSDEVVRWQFETRLDSGAWQVQTYNTGNYPHTIQIRFYVDLVDSGTATAAVVALDPSAIAGDATTDLTAISAVDSADTVTDSGGT